MLFSGWFYAHTVPKIRIAAALLTVAITPVAVCAESGESVRRGEAGGSWQLAVLDDGQLRPVEHRRGRGAGIVPVSLNRDAAGADASNAWSLQLGIVRPSMQLHSTSFGPTAGIPVAGDFNGDGYAELGVFADGRWYLDFNANNTWDEGDLTLTFGRTGDLPVVGDWNQDGKADLGVYTAAADSNAVAVVGDWTGTGIDRVGLFADGEWQLDTNGDGLLTSSDATVQLGQAGDRPIVGDFNRDGMDDLGVYRNGQWVMDTNGDRRFGSDDLTYVYGSTSDLPVIGDWDGDGRDQIGLLHR